MSAKKTHFIKCRRHGEKRWAFVGPGEVCTRLRVHAARYAESEASREVAVLANVNPEFEFKAVPIDGKP